MGSNHRLEVLLIASGFDLRRNLERHAGLLCNLDRKIRTLFKRDSPQKGEVFAGFGVELKASQVESMVDGAGPVQAWGGVSL